MIHHKNATEIARVKYAFNKGNWDDMRKDLSNISWVDLIEKDDAGKMLWHSIEQIVKYIHICIRKNKYP